MLVHSVEIVLDIIPFLILFILLLINFFDKFSTYFADEQPFHRHFVVSTIVERLAFGYCVN